MSVIPEEKKEEVEFLVEVRHEAGIVKDKKKELEERLMNIVNVLLTTLYKVADDGFIIDESKVNQIGSQKEPINWGGLSCVDVEYDENLDVYIVTIEEAAEDACPNFCNYIQNILLKWGWKTIVKTQW